MPSNKISGFIHKVLRINYALDKTKTIIF